MCIWRPPVRQLQTVCCCTMLRKLEMSPGSCCCLYSTLRRHHWPLGVAYVFVRPTELLIVFKFNKAALCAGIYSEHLLPCHSGVYYRCGEAGKEPRWGLREWGGGWRLRTIKTRVCETLGARSNRTSYICTTGQCTAGHSIHAVNTKSPVFTDRWDSG